MKKLERVRVLSQEVLTEEIISLWIEVPFAEEARAGQFVSFYMPDGTHMLPRPISICDKSVRLGALRFVYRIVGEGTRWLSTLRTGDTAEVIGPLGNGFPLEIAAGKRLLLLGGGLGVPPMLGCAHAFDFEPCAAGDPSENVPLIPPKSITAALGYRHEPFLLEELRECAAVYHASDDGFSGMKGTVLDAARQNPFPVDLIFACGPKGMLHYAAAYARELGVPCYVSMEERMACGVGACLGCVVNVKEEDPHYGTKKRRVCADGPVFPAELIEEL